MSDSGHNWMLDTHCLLPGQPPAPRPWPQCWSCPVSSPPSCPSSHCSSHSSTGDGDTWTVPCLHPPLWCWPCCHSQPWESTCHWVLEHHVCRTEVPHCSAHASVYFVSLTQRSEKQLWSQLPFSSAPADVWTVWTVWTEISGLSHPPPWHGWCIPQYLNTTPHQQVGNHSESISQGNVENYICSNQAWQNCHVRT